METELFREKIVKEYVKYRKPEKKLTDVWSNDEYIKFYEDNKRSLNFLLLDINEYFVDNKEKNLIIDKNDSNDMFKAYVNCPGLDAKGTRPSERCE